MYISIRDSSDNPQKDTFHNLIFAIDKIVTFGIVNSTILMKLSLSRKGVVDGERPLEFELDITSSFRNLNPSSIGIRSALIPF
jgi:hypothetical protein